MNWTDEAKKKAEEEKILQRQAEIDRQLSVITAQKAKEQEIKNRFWEINSVRFEEIQQLLDAHRSDQLYISEPVEGKLETHDYLLREAKSFVIAYDEGGDPDYSGASIASIYGVCWEIREESTKQQMRLLLGVRVISKVVKKGIFPFRHEEEEFVYFPSLTALEVEKQIKAWLNKIYSR